MNTTEAAYGDIGVLSDVLWSVSLFDTTMSPAKTAEPIEVPFGPKESCMRWGRDTFTEMVKFDGVRHIGMHWDCLMCCTQPKGAFSYQ